MCVLTIMRASIDDGNEKELMFRALFCMCVTIESGGVLFVCARTQRKMCFTSWDLAIHENVPILISSVLGWDFVIRHIITHLVVVIDVG